MRRGTPPRRRQAPSPGSPKDATPLRMDSLARPISPDPPSGDPICVRVLFDWPCRRLHRRGSGNPEKRPRCRFYRREQDCDCLGDSVGQSLFKPRVDPLMLNCAIWIKTRRAISKTDRLLWAAVAAHRHTPLVHSTIKVAQRLFTAS